MEKETDNFPYLCKKKEYVCSKNSILNSYHWCISKEAKTDSYVNTYLNVIQLDTNKIGNRACCLKSKKSQV